MVRKDKINILRRINQIEDSNKHKIKIYRQLITRLAFFYVKKNIPLHSLFGKGKKNAFSVQMFYT